LGPSHKDFTETRLASRGMSRSFQSVRKELEIYGVVVLRKEPPPLQDGQRAWLKHQTTDLIPNFPFLIE
ncbi:MAG: hypothetical protein ABI618_10780, partial [Nitrospirota bacterium]